MPKANKSLLTLRPRKYEATVQIIIYEVNIYYIRRVSRFYFDANLPENQDVRKQEEVGVEVQSLNGVEIGKQLKLATESESHVD